MDKNDTKKMLFMTAMDLFREKGYENVSIMEICEKSGTTRNAFYYHYKSKEDMLCYYFEYLPSSDSTLLEGLLKQPNDWEKLLFIKEYHVRLMVKEGAEFTRQLIMATILSKREIMMNYELASKLCTPLIEQCQKAGLITLSTPAETLNAVTTKIVYSSVIEWSISEQDYDVAARVRQTLIDLLRPEK